MVTITAVPDVLRKPGGRKAFPCEESQAPGSQGQRVGDRALLSSPGQSAGSVGGRSKDTRCRRPESERHRGAVPACAWSAPLPAAVRPLADGAPAAPRRTPARAPLFERMRAKRLASNKQPISVKYHFSFLTILDAFLSHKNYLLEFLLPRVVTLRSRLIPFSTSSLNKKEHFTTSSSTYFPEDVLG